MWTFLNNPDTDKYQGQLILSFTKNNNSYVYDIQNIQKDGDAFRLVCKEGDLLINMCDLSPYLYKNVDKIFETYPSLRSYETAWQAHWDKPIMSDKLNSLDAEQLGETARLSKNANLLTQVYERAATAFSSVKSIFQTLINNMHTPAHIKLSSAGKAEVKTNDTMVCVQLGQLCDQVELACIRQGIPILRANGDGLLFMESHAQRVGQIIQQAKSSLSLASQQMTNTRGMEQSYSGR